MKFLFFKPKQQSKSKKGPKTLKQILNEAWSKELRHNPDLLKRVSAKEAGHLDLLDAINDIELLKQKKLAEALANDPEFMEQVKQEYLHGAGGDTKGELEEAVDQTALELVQSNPEMMQRLAEKRLSKLVSGRSSGSAFSDLANELDTLEELQERLGGKKSEGFKITPELLTSIIENIPAILGKGDGLTPKVYVIEKPDGTLMETNANGYKTYLEDKPKKQIAAPIEQPQQVKVEQPQQVEVKQTLNLSSWIPYLDQEPEVFVAYLNENLDPNSHFIISVLESKTADELIETLQPFKSKDAETKEAIEKLEQYKEWLEEVIKLVRERRNAEI